MKTFEKFVNDSGGYGPPVSLTRKPVFRSSAIFPIVKNSSYNSRVLFMGYWILKREIAEIGLVYTLRDEDGNLLGRKSNCINSPKAYVLELDEMLPENFRTGDFAGSIELEVFSSRDMVFPYPAFVLEYYNDTFSTCVHTTGRVFNDFEDLKDTDDYKVAESGFDIYGSSGLEPFFAFVNGPLENEEPIELEIINSANQSEKVSLTGLHVKPYATAFIYLKKHFPQLDTFLGSKPGTAKVRHKLKGFFPRFLAGNFNTKANTASITHSYYDCSPLTDEGAYWKRATDEMYDSSIFAPVFMDKDRTTEIVFYPIYSPSDYTIDLDFLDIGGKSIKKLKSFKTLNQKQNELFRLNFNDIASDENIPAEQVKAVFISKSWPGSDMIPNRLKFGLNVSTGKSYDVLSSNICFNSELGIPKTLQKVGTRKWAPIINSGESVIVINNTTTLKTYDRSANINYKIFRTSDNSYIERNIVIPPMGQERINTVEDSEVRDFIGGQPGWIYIESDNPFANAWYFNFGTSGVVAADHSF